MKSAFPDSKNFIVCQSAAGSSLNAPREFVYGSRENNH